MPDTKFYVPENKLDTVLNFKKEFGHTWGQLLLDFMEAKLSTTPKLSRREQVEHVFKKFFGDITNEREFIDMMGFEDAQTAIRRRVRDACSADKEIYDDIIIILRERLPRLAELGGYRK